MTRGRAPLAFGDPSVLMIGLPHSRGTGRPAAIFTATGFPADLSTIEELETMIGEILAQA